VRETVEFLDVDRPLHHDHTAMMEVVRDGGVLDAVEGVVGPLG